MSTTQMDTFDSYVKTITEMENKIIEYLQKNDTAIYSNFYGLFSARRRAYLRELLEDLVNENVLATHWRRDPGQPPVKIYSLAPRVNALDPKKLGLVS